MNLRKLHRRPTRQEQLAAYEDEGDLFPVSGHESGSASGDEPEEDPIRPKRIEGKLPNGLFVVIEWILDRLNVEFGAQPKIELTDSKIGPNQFKCFGPIRITYRPQLAVECPGLVDDDCPGPFHPFWVIEMFPNRPHSPEWNFYLFPDGTYYAPFEHEQWEQLPDGLLASDIGDETTGDGDDADEMVGSAVAVS